jgi:hypothetical protein
MIEIFVKLLDALLGGLVSKWRERKALAAELETLKRRVLYVGVTHNLPVELHKLRSFLIDRGLVERPGIRRFFARWLNTAPVVMGAPGLNAFSREAIATLQADLRSLRL